MSNSIEEEPGGTKGGDYTRPKLTREWQAISSVKKENWGQKRECRDRDMKKGTRGGDSIQKIGIRYMQKKEHIKARR